jgi:hypothetical protein
LLSRKFVICSLPRKLYTKCRKPETLICFANQQLSFTLLDQSPIETDRQISLERSRLFSGPNLSRPGLIGGSPRMSRKLFGLLGETICYYRMLHQDGPTKRLARLK